MGKDQGKTNVIKKYEVINIIRFVIPRWGKTGETSPVFPRFFSHSGSTWKPHILVEPPSKVYSFCDWSKGPRAVKKENTRQ